MFKKDQKVIYLKEGVFLEGEIIDIQETPILNQHLDIIYKSHLYSIITCEKSGPIISVLNADEIIDKDEWIKNNRDDKITNIVDG